MNSMAPDLSGLVPFMIAFFAVLQLPPSCASQRSLTLQPRSSWPNAAPAPRGPTASWRRVSSSEGPSPGEFTGPLLGPVNPMRHGSKCREDRR